MERLESKIFKTFVFVADDEDELINGDDMSSLSDVFDDDDENIDDLSDNEVNESTSVPSVLPMSIDDIPFDREVKWINVPNSSRPKASIILGNSKLLKQIHGIASSNAIDTNSSNGHNNKNRDVEKRLFEVPTSATTHGGDRRPKREPRPKIVKGRGKDKEEGQESKRVERSNKRGKEPQHKRNQSAEHVTSEKYNSEVALDVEDEPKSDLTSRRQSQPGEVKQRQPPRKTEPLASNTLQHIGQNGYHVIGVSDEEARRHPQRGRNSATSDRQRMDVPQRYTNQWTPAQSRSQPQQHLAPDFDQGRRLDSAPVRGDGRTRQYYAPNQGDARYDQHNGYDYGNSWEGSEGYHGEALAEDYTAGYQASQSLSGEFDGRSTEMYGGHLASHHQYMSARSHDRFSQNNHASHNHYTPPHSSYSQRSSVPASGQKVPLFVPPVCETSTANLNPMAFEFVPSFAPPH